MTTYSSGKNFSLKSCRRGGGGRKLLLAEKKFFRKKFLKGAPKKSLPRVPAKLSAALVKLHTLYII
jgi:hypothetical protein